MHVEGRKYPCDVPVICIDVQDSVLPSVHVTSTQREDENSLLMYICR